MAHEVISSALSSIDAYPVRVQIDSSPGLHDLSIVGLGDKAVQESADRIEAAIKHSGFAPPRSKNKRFIINLAPADTKKEGPGFDLPIAIAYLLESRQIQASPANTLFLGELGLDGKLAHASGILAAAMLAKSMGKQQLVVPAENADEAAIVEGISVIGARNLAEVVAHITQQTVIAPSPVPKKVQNAPIQDEILSSIRGQLAAKRALVVAAAGGHNVLMCGSPGSGKTILARSLSALLPPLTIQEALEVAKIYSSSGLMKGSVLDLPRPFCAPHHTASSAAIVGGGTTVRPGQVSLAHRGVLFLDEMPEFARNVIEALRQPLEDGIVTISRASGSLMLPAKFMLVGAMNPCPCGNLGDPKSICICSPMSVSRYAKKISGPLLDRIDIQLFVSREGMPQGTVSEISGESLEATREKISRARAMQITRLSNMGLVTNSEINYRDIERLCQLDTAARTLLESVVSRKGLSLRSYHKIQKIARTIADLEASPDIKTHHVAEALTLRVNDRIEKAIGA